MKLNKLVMFGLAFLAILVIITIGSFKTGNLVKEDIFDGIITNMNLQPQVLEGEGVYDRGCNPVEGGLTQCDAGIQTEKGLLNFNYKHFMHSQPCIDNGDKVKVEILAEGRARVTRY